MTATQGGDLGELRTAAEAGDARAARELGHRLCVLGAAVGLEVPGGEPEAGRWLRRALDADPADPITATLLAGLLHRQLTTTLNLSPLYDGLGAPGTDRATWLTALGSRYAEALRWYRHALALDPASAAAACGLALVVLDEGWTQDFVYFERGGAEDPEGLDDEDPAARAEAAGHLRRILAAEPGNAVAAHLLDRLA